MQIDRLSFTKILFCISGRQTEGFWRTSPTKKQNNTPQRSYEAAPQVPTTQNAPQSMILLIESTDFH